MTCFESEDRSGGVEDSLVGEEMGSSEVGGNSYGFEGSRNG